MHERIHLAQQRELGIIGFYIAYSLNYLINLIKYKDRQLAYKNIVFEKEAWFNENNHNYLNVRKPYNYWIK